jgi:hypothetical protein
MIALETRNAIAAEIIAKTSRATSTGDTIENYSKATATADSTGSKQSGNSRDIVRN